MSIKQNKLFSTKKTVNYNIFKTLPFQRPVSGEHVFKIEKSIKENNMLISNPIIVDKNLYIVDGQHRLAAARNLKLPIYYFQLDEDALKNPNTIINLNTQARWMVKDYINFYATQGYPEYIRFQNLMKQFDAPATVMSYLAKCAGGHNYTHDLRSGALKFIAETEEFLEIFMNFNREARDFVQKKYHPMLKSQVWAAAHLHCFRALEERYLSFLEAIKKGLPSIVAFRLVDDYLNFFNVHANKGIRLNRFEILDYNE